MQLFCIDVLLNIGNW